MCVERLLLVLPSGSEVSGLTVHQWADAVEQFAVRGGCELILGGSEPLGFGGFWVLARRAARARVPLVTAYVSGSLLEPWVVRQLAESGLRLLLALDSLQAGPHDTMHGMGSHARALAAVDKLNAQGLGSRLGLLVTATRLNHEELPALAGWAAGRGLANLVWTTAPDGGWPSAQLKALCLTAPEKAALAAEMDYAARLLAGGFHISPTEFGENSSLRSASARPLRLHSSGDASWGLAGDGPVLGNLKRATLHSLLDRNAQAAGD